MALFEHYLYVLNCGDGSLYTGYTTDVAARVAAHQAGTGAKYTKSHAPVSLAAQARFFSKERAMSAEARFKQLSRKEKDVLLQQAEHEPFEDVLCRELPNFGKDSAIEFVCRSAAENIDPRYREFQARLIPSIDSRSIAGVRTPILRKIAKQLVKRDDAKSFLRALPHHSFEENQVHAFALGLEKDHKKALKLYDKFLPYVDNWATCDQLPTRPLMQQPEAALSKTYEWIASDHCYTKRFGIGVLMQHFLDDLFEPRFLADVAATAFPDSTSKPPTENDTYYLNMMRAWYFAEALAHQEAATLPYLETKGEAAPLDEWTRRKAIQKAIESRRIAPEMKDYLRTCK